MAQYLSPGVYVEEVPPGAPPIAGVGTSTAAFIGQWPDTYDLPAPLKGRPGKFVKVTRNSPAAKTPLLVTSWTQFVSTVGDLVGEEQTTGTAETNPVVIDNGWRRLAHAVFGFFANGGTRCWVVRAAVAGDIAGCLAALATIDEVAIIAAPGLTAKAAQEAVIDHCASLEDRFAVLDGAQTATPPTKANIQGTTKDSPYAAIYFPWVRVSDPSELAMGTGDGSIIVPPSGHIAGVYAQVDATRGVFKAPANVSLRDALDVSQPLAKADQDGLNPAGVNVIRLFNSNRRVWGARTMGGDANGEFRYVSTRRYFNYLRESIDEGTQWVVFEPNSSALWQRITRSVGDFLLGEWRSGALLGDTPKQAFFVKCDAETNPPDVRERGQVVTLVGVAIVKPAEFVIFRIQQMTGG